MTQRKDGGLLPLSFLFFIASGTKEGPCTLRKSPALIFLGNPHGTRREHDVGKRPPNLSICLMCEKREDGLATTRGSFRAIFWGFWALMALSELFDGALILSLG